VAASPAALRAADAPPAKDAQPGKVAQPAKARRRGKPFEETKCGQCIALCCRYIALEVDAPTEPKDFENLRWYMLHERVTIFVEGRRWYVQIFNKCTALGPDNQCTRYETRPAICREYTDSWCDRDEVAGKTADALTFHTLDQLESWRDTWVKRWEARRRRARRQSAEKAAATRRKNARRRKPARRKSART